MDELGAIYSMTGYAVVTRDLPQGSLNLELRSLNNRYLDIQFRLPGRTPSAGRIDARVADCGG